MRHHLKNSASSVKPPNHFQAFRLNILHSIYSRKETVILTCTLHVIVFAHSCASGMGLKPLEIKECFIYFFFTQFSHTAGIVTKKDIDSKVRCSVVMVIVALQIANHNQSQNKLSTILILERRVSFWYQY